MLQKLEVILNDITSFAYKKSYSVYELVLLCLEKINETVDYVNGVESKVDNNYTTLNNKIDQNFQQLDSEKEDSVNITNNRKLSPTGNFTGSLNGETVTNVLNEIGSTTDLANEIISLINARESIGWVLDGGLFPNTDPPVYDFDGGVF